MQWFVNLNLLKKIMLVSAVMMISAWTWGSFNAYMAYNIMEKDVKERNKFLVETAHSMIDGLQKDVADNKLTKDDAQSQAKIFLRKARYENGKQYFWINGTNGQAIMHPMLPELETQDISQTKKNVYDLFMSFAKAVEKNPDGIEFDYMWPKPGMDKTLLFPKSSYIMAIPEWGWIVGTGVYVDELKNKAMVLFYYEMGFVAVFAFILIVGTYFSVRLLSKPMQQLANNMNDLAGGNLNVDVPHRNRKDEVGMIAKAFSVFKDNAIEKSNLEKSQIELQKKAELEKKEAMHSLARSFEERTSGIIMSLSESADQLSGSAKKMKDDSEENVATSHSVAQAINEANQNVQTVAAATEELSVSSQEIARQISGVAEKSNRSSQEAEKTNAEILKLNEMANSIGDVVSAIKGIAEQTNLLALNATIEAARAGEAGKGFAVVADEVKKLATETANKTTEIDERVALIQQAIRNTVTAVHSILEDVKDIDHATSTVASAVEEQNAATSEIGRNISEASGGTQIVAQNISDVLRNSENTVKSAASVLSASDKLSIISESLQSQVESFLKEIRG
jgi:methyl-accepting chemotaxis protein